MAEIPTERLYVQDADNWEAEARAFAEKLIQEGKRPWFEVFYPAPSHLTEAQKTEWLDRQENQEGVGTFDAIELVNGVFVTLPPYAVLQKES